MTMKGEVAGIGRLMAEAVERSVSKYLGTCVGFLPAEEREQISRICG